MRGRILRSLSGSEKVWLMTGSLSPPFVITLVVEGNGIAPRALQAAVAQAATVNPGAQAILQSGLGGQRWLHGDRPPVVRCLPGPPQPGILEGAPQLDAGPGLAIGVAPAPAPAIVFRVHHALMDGRGLLHLVEEVFRALRAEPLLGGADQLGDMQLVRARAAAPRSAERRRFIAATGRHEGATQPVWGRRRVEGAWHELLPRVAAGVLRFARQSDAAAPVRFHIPVDLRRYAGQRSTSNLTGIVSIDPEPGAGVVEIASALQEKLATDEALRWVGGLKVVGRLPLWFLRLGGKKKAATALRTSRFDATAVLMMPPLAPEAGAVSPRSVLPATTRVGHR